MKSGTRVLVSLLTHYALPITSFVMNSPFVILNPAARSGRAGNFTEVLQELPGNPVVRFTTSPREAEELAREAVDQGYKKFCLDSLQK